MLADGAGGEVRSFQLAMARCSSSRVSEDFESRTFFCSSESDMNDRR